jgi:hypothetical protein
VATRPASTDTGHTGAGAAWAAGHPEKIIDWGYRSEHLTAVDSKQAITNFYGIGPKLSYFTGCSGGGRMAFQEAQRYPADFDAILAGAPAYDRGNEAFGFMAKWAGDSRDARQLHSNDEVPGHSSSSARCMRRTRRSEGRAHRGRPQLPFRSEGARVQGRHERRLVPHNAAGRSGAEAVRRCEAPQDR